MGNCHRRQGTYRHHRDIHEDLYHEDEWTLIVNQVGHTPNGRFIRIVKRVMKLLILRRIFAKAGHYLGTSVSRRAENAHIRTVMAYIFTTWPRAVLKNNKTIFGHLKRERGRLVYAH